MAKKQTFLTAEWSEAWKESYPRLSADRQAACNEAILQLIKRTDSAGLRIKPIHPDKFYLEARINSGDRIIFRVGEGKIYFVDIVEHNDISRYGKRPKRVG